MSSVPIPFDAEHPEKWRTIEDTLNELAEDARKVRAETEDPWRILRADKKFQQLLLKTGRSMEEIKDLARQEAALFPIQPTNQKQP
jgi:hypothetical protein